jgi:hypothetical protein
MSLNYWGILMIVIGILLFLGGLYRSQFIIYRLLVARSKILWKENTDKFHQIAGLLIVIAGIVVSLGLL